MRLYRKCPQCGKDCGTDKATSKTLEVCPSCTTNLKGQIWFLDFLVNGVRKREAVHENRRLAEQVMAKRKVEIVEGKYFERQKKRDYTLREILNDFLDYSKNNKRSYVRDVGLVANLLSFFKGSDPAKDIIPNDIEKFKAFRQSMKKKPAPATINRELAALKRAYNIARDNDKVITNPVERVKMLDEENLRIRYLREEEQTRLLEACLPHVRPIVETALMTGMRKSEILDLKWKDVDFERKIIYIVKTKSKKQREVPIAPKLDIILKKLFNKASSPNDHVFVTSRGHHKYHKIDTIFEKAVREAGIEDFTFHDLRHSFASYMVMEGHGLPVVKEVLGHSDIRTTMRYTHVSKEHIRKAVDSMGEMLDRIWSKSGQQDDQPEAKIDTQPDTIDTLLTPEQNEEKVASTKYIEI